MTKEDIKEALEACTDINIPCGNCPYNGVGNCYDSVKNDARELIIAQESEIEQLRTTLGQKTNDPKQAKWKFLLVEDGSIDVDGLQQFFDEQDMNIKIVIYRQGAPKPELKEF